MIESVKKAMIDVLWNIFCRHHSIADQLRGWRRTVYLAKLYRENIPAWRVIKAREKGVKVGINCQFYSINFHSECNLIEIGDNVIISGDVKFVTHDGGVFLLKDEIHNLCGNYGRIKIGNNCFIGMGAIICQNVEIGSNSIVAAGAVVFESFPDGSVIMGNPAKTVFKFDMYRKMKKNSPFTLAHDVYPFPKKIPTREKMKLVEEKIAILPIKKPRKSSVLSNI